MFSSKANVAVCELGCKENLMTFFYNHRLKLVSSSPGLLRNGGRWRSGEQIDVITGGGGAYLPKIVFTTEQALPCLAPAD